MPIKLDFNLIREIISHGTKVRENETVDPSTSDILKSAGLAKVTTYIEQLSLLNLISDPYPIIGKNGGMWIGYRLTKEGRAISDSQQVLRRAVADLTGDAKHEVSESVRELHSESQQAYINENYRIDFLRTLEEIAICFDNECYIASIGLCGKILEVCLKEILDRHNVEIRSRAMIGELIKAIREKIPSEYIDPALINITDIINRSRITAVHAKEKVPIPSRDQAIMVIFAMRDVVKRNLSHR